MAAKRTSVISILAALVLIASFLSALLPQAISPEPVYANTSTYTFASGGGTDKWCWHGHVHLADWNNGHPTSPSDFASSYGYAAGGSTEYTAVSTSNNAWWRSNIAHDLGCCSGDRNIELFKFTINENPSDITNIQVKWEGHGTTGETIYYTTEKLWKPSNSTWNQLHNQQNVTSDTTWTDNIASGCSDYIDGSGYLYVIVCSQRSGINSNCGIWTDYIEIVITYTSNSAPTITSVTLQNSGKTGDVSAMSPQTAYVVQIVAGDADTIDDINQIDIWIFRDDNAGDDGTPGGTWDADHEAIYRWTKSGSTWSMQNSSATTTWSITTGSCDTPGNMAATSGEWNLYFTVGKLAQEADGTSAEWDVKVTVTDSVSNTVSSTIYSKSMGAYSSLSLSSSTISFGSIALGGTAAIQTPAEHYVTLIAISNDNFALGSKSSSPWTNGGNNATLDTDGSPGAGYFSLTQDDAGDVSGHPSTPQYVTTATADITGLGSIGRTSTIAGASEGTTNTNIYMDCILGASGLKVLTYSGTITFTITNN